MAHQLRVGTVLAKDLSSDPSIYNKVAYFSWAPQATAFTYTYLKFIQIILLQTHFSVLIFFILFELDFSPCGVSTHTTCMCTRPTATLTSQAQSAVLMKYY